MTGLSMPPSAAARHAHPMWYRVDVGFPSPIPLVEPRCGIGFSPTTFKDSFEDRCCWDRFDRFKALEFRDSG